MSTKFQIRPATVKDLPIIMQLIRDLAEYLADTDPLDPQTRLRITEFRVDFSPEQSTWTLTWTSPPPRTHEPKVEAGFNRRSRPRPDLEPARTPDSPVESNVWRTGRLAKRAGYRSEPPSGCR